ncbi:MAG: hypothetical protein KatS3mg111_1253 [Pirellulaceae bacterium]|nr:MAG: hypothetical protein KatS3mg111_1253 [Pirellulaceae bacterium]
MDGHSCSQGGAFGGYAAVALPLYVGIRTGMAAIPNRPGAWETRRLWKLRGDAGLGPGLSWRCPFGANCRPEDCGASREAAMQSGSPRVARSILLVGSEPLYPHRSLHLQWKYVLAPISKLSAIVGSEQDCKYRLQERG